MIRDKNVFHEQTTKEVPGKPRDKCSYWYKEEKYGSVQAEDDKSQTSRVPAVRIVEYGKTSLGGKYDKPNYED
jgi:hypothetical protein